MKIRTEIGLTIGALVLVQLATSFAAIALLTRMSPAIERIRGENLVSIEAVDEMLAALAAHGRPPGERREAFALAFERARANVSEPEEDPLLDTIAAHAEQALAGQPAEVDLVVEALGRLTAVNHASTERADRQAKRLGSTGAWAAALLGIVGLLLSAGAIHRLSLTLLRPLAQLDAVAEAHRGGDRYRRAGDVGGGGELRAVANSFDEILDERLSWSSQVAPPSAAAAADRRVMLHLLDREDDPTAVVGPDGDVLAANRLALDLLAGPEGPRLQERLRAAVQAEDGQADGVHAQRVAEGTWLCRIPAAPAGADG